MSPNESTPAQNPTGLPGQATTPGMVFYRRQIALLEARDIEGLMGQYHEDACLVSFDAVVKGRAAIGAHLKRYLNHLGDLKLQSTDRFAEASDAIIFESTLATGLGEARVYDVFVLRNGQATHHFAGVLAGPRPG